MVIFLPHDLERLDTALSTGYYHDRTEPADRQAGLRMNICFLAIFLPTNYNRSALHVSINAQP
jgi:hypothetical protein